MSGSEIIDWDETTLDERKMLHKHVLKLKKRVHLDWKTLFQRAFGAQDNVGDGYEDNLRRGRIAPAKAYKLFIWLDQNDPVLASNVEDDILALRSTASPERSARWETLLAMGKFTGVEVYKYDSGLGMAEFSRREPIHRRSLKLLEEFYFAITVPFECTLIAFQGLKGFWYPQVVAEGTNILDVSTGNCIIPSNELNQPDPIWEDSVAGKHSYMFLLTQDPEVVRMAPPLTSSLHRIPTKVCDDLANQIFASSEETWALFRINIMFKSG